MPNRNRRKIKPDATDKKQKDIHTKKSRRKTKKNKKAQSLTSTQISSKIITLIEKIKLEKHLLTSSTDQEKSASESDLKLTCSLMLLQDKIDEVYFKKKLKIPPSLERELFDLLIMLESPDKVWHQNKSRKLIIPNILIAHYFYQKDFKKIIELTEYIHKNTSENPPALLEQVAKAYHNEAYNIDKKNKDKTKEIYFQIIHHELMAVSFFDILSKIENDEKAGIHTPKILNICMMSVSRSFEMLFNNIFDQQVFNTLINEISLFLKNYRPPLLSDSRYNHISTILLNDKITKRNSFCEENKPLIETYSSHCKAEKIIKKQQYEAAIQCYHESQEQLKKWNASGSEASEYKNKFQDHIFSTLARLYENAARQKPTKANRLNQQGLYCLQRMSAPLKPDSTRLERLTRACAKESIPLLSFRFRFFHLASSSKAPTAHSYLTSQGYDPKALKAMEASPEAQMPARPAQKTIELSYRWTLPNDIFLSSEDLDLPKIKNMKGKPMPSFFFYDVDSLNLQYPLGMKHISTFERIAKEPKIVKATGSTGLTILHEIKGSVTIESEVKLNHPFDYEMKISRTKKRVFCYSISSDCGRANLVIASVYSKEGLHKKKGSSGLKAPSFYACNLPIKEKNTKKETPETPRRNKRLPL